jgi:hypothetical protein
MYSYQVPAPQAVSNAKTGNMRKWVDHCLLVDEMLAWCKSRKTENWEFVEDQTTFRFKSQNDYIMFLLRWAS